MAYVPYVPVAYNPALYMHHSTGSFNSLHGGIVTNIIGFLVVSLILLGSMVLFIAMGNYFKEEKVARFMGWGLALVSFLTWLLLVCCLLGI